LDADSPVTFKAFVTSVPPPMPEPAAVALLGLGLAVPASAARKRWWPDQAPVAARGA